MNTMKAYLSILAMASAIGPAMAQIAFADFLSDRRR